MNNLEQNWNNLFGKYTTDETAWYGSWTVYSSTQEVMSNKQVIRSFRANADNTVITHINRHIDADGNVVDEKIWQLNRATCSQPDGVVHPAMPSMRALSFGAGATAWISQKLIPRTPFGVELFFRDRDWRTSAGIIYGVNGQLKQIIQIREHLGCFPNELLSLESLKVLREWRGKKRSMTPDLSISPEEDTQISFKPVRHRKLISLNGNLMLLLPERVDIDEVRGSPVVLRRGLSDQPIEIAAGQRIADHHLKYLAAHYTTAGEFTLLVSGTLQS